MSNHKECEWQWGIYYSKDCNYLELVKTSHIAVLVEMLMASSFILWFTRFLWVYDIINKVMIWAWNQQTVVWTLKLTQEQLEEINPGDWMNSLMSLMDEDDGTAEVST